MWAKIGLTRQLDRCQPDNYFNPWIRCTCYCREALFLQAIQRICCLSSVDQMMLIHELTFVYSKIHHHLTYRVASSRSVAHKAVKFIWHKFSTIVFYLKITSLQCHNFSHNALKSAKTYTLYVFVVICILHIISLNIDMIHVTAVFVHLSPLFWSGVMFPRRRIIIFQNPVIWLP